MKNCIQILPQIALSVKKPLQVSLVPASSYFVTEVYCVILRNMRSNTIIFVICSTLVLIDKVNSDEHTRAEIERDVAHPPFDPDIYEEALDAEQCRKQIEYLTLNDTLLTMTCKYYSFFKYFIPSCKIAIHDSFIVLKLPKHEQNSCLITLIVINRNARYTKVRASLVAIFEDDSENKLQALPLVSLGTILDGLFFLIDSLVHPTKRKNVTI